MITDAAFCYLDSTSRNHICSHNAHNQTQFTVFKHLKALKPTNLPVRLRGIQRKENK